VYCCLQIDDVNNKRLQEVKHFSNNKAVGFEQFAPIRDVFESQRFSWAQETKVPGFAALYKENMVYNTFGCPTYVALCLPHFKFGFLVS
jgi:hypothetical protein